MRLSADECYTGLESEYEITLTAPFGSFLNVIKPLTSQDVNEIRDRIIEIYDDYLCPPSHRST